VRGYLDRRPAIEEGPTVDAVLIKGGEYGDEFIECGANCVAKLFRPLIAQFQSWHESRLEGDLEY